MQMGAIAAQLLELLSVWQLFNAAGLVASWNCGLQGCSVGLALLPTEDLFFLHIPRIFHASKGFRDLHW